MDLERRYCELRQDEGMPRRLRGVLLTYDAETSIGGLREKFLPGAFGNVADVDVILNWQHQRSRPLARTQGGGLTLRDTNVQLELEAVLPQTREADDALELVRTGVLRGLSIEFHARDEAMAGRVRVIKRADLVGAGLVDSPAYLGSVVEARREERARLSTRIRGRIPYNKTLSCGCHKGTCSTIKIEPGAFESAVKGEQQVLAISGEFSGALAALSRGTLKLKDDKDGLIAEVELPDTTVARDLIAQVDTVPIVMRPVFLQDLSEFTETGDVATYRKMRLRALLLGTTDADGGWPSVELVEPDEPRHHTTPKQEVRVWL